MNVVSFDARGPIAYVTVNRPEVLNCFDYPTLERLQAVVQQIHLTTEIQAVIFTGAGEEAFSAGADLKERRRLNEREVRRNVKTIRELFTSIENLPQPTIAAINGYALGGGLEWALACDFRIAVEEAVLGLTEVSWAIIPGAGGTQRLPRLIGGAKAMELILTARKITAQAAFELGILNRVVKKEELLPACTALATEMVENGPLAVQQAKYAIRNGLNVDLTTGMVIEAQAYERLIPTQDRLEALQAFQEKRKPRFRGE